MKWPQLVLMPPRRATQVESEARLHSAVDRLDALTKRLETVVADVEKGDLGGTREQRGEGV